MSILNVTAKAQQQMKALMAQAPEDAKGLRVTVKQGGCSGYEYDIDYAAEKEKFGEVVELEGYKLFVDPRAIMFLVGAEIDYKEERFASGFSFSNPNETGRCGCGESISFAI